MNRENARLFGAQQRPKAYVIRLKVMLLIALISLVSLIPRTVLAEEAVVLVWGDSLSAAYGLNISQGWPHLLQERLNSNKLAFRVENGSVSGETSAGGLARFPSALAEHQPAIVLLALGANDGLRGLPVTALQEQLSAMIEYAQAAGSRVLLFEMKIPPNYGPRYTSSFEQVYTQLAETYSIELLPFWLESIALDPSYMLADGLHPNAKAQPILLDHVWQGLEPLLRLSDI